MLRIYVDFNTMMTDPEERVYINAPLHDGLAAKLRPGRTVLLWSEDLEVQAVIEYDEDHGDWLARPDWSTSQDLPYDPDSIHAGARKRVS